MYVCVRARVGMCPVNEQGKTLSSVALVAVVACDSSVGLLTFVHERLGGGGESLAHTVCNVTIVPQQSRKFHKELVCVL